MYFKYIFWLLSPAGSGSIRAAMHLSAYSDYALRVLMLATLRRPDWITIGQVADTFTISRHHLVKVVHGLSKLGYLKTRRGVHGGFTLGLPPEEIRLGKLIRESESSLSLVECFEPETNACRLMPACRLKAVLGEAVSAFFGVLNDYTLADLTRQPARLKAALGE